MLAHEAVLNKIYVIRNKKVMLDRDLATLYDVETRVLNQAVKRNLDIFPPDFMFQLSVQEWEEMSSQIVTTSGTKRPKSALPLAFTEYGVSMLANVLKSKKARQTSIIIVRAFIALKQFALNYKEITDRLTELENKNSKQFKDIYEAINYLLQKDQQETAQKERQRIGFKIIPKS